mmetsp:Transcript_21195/g.42911  ORF Transcript_21195/g.42911 Transcript_21195/m.42911 type:complete len:87 (-) Transcript_21195:301-561(-)
MIGDVVVVVVVIIVVVVVVVVVVGGMVVVVVVSIQGVMREALDDALALPAFAKNCGCRLIRRESSRFISSCLVERGRVQFAATRLS